MKDSLREALAQIERHFRFSLAVGDAERKKVFALRYQVYCREFQFEREEDCPGGLETDAFDDNAVHCLLEHRSSGLVAGCVRMVLPAMDSSCTLDALPLERHCHQSLSHGSLHPGRLPRQSVCEISRLAVAGFFRRRQGEDKSLVGDIDSIVLSPAAMRTAPVMGLSLFLAATVMVGMAGRHHVFAMMERRLVRLLSRSGFGFHRVGEFVDYHGQRAAYYIDQTQVVAGMHQSMRDLYGSIEAQIHPYFVTLARDAGMGSCLTPRPERDGHARSSSLHKSA